MILFLTSRMFRNFMDYTTMLFLTFKMFRNFTDYTTTLFLTSRMLRNFYGLRNNTLFWGPKGNKEGSKADRKCPRTKLGYDTSSSFCACSRHAVVVRASVCMLSSVPTTIVTFVMSPLYLYFPLVD